MKMEHTTRNVQTYHRMYHLVSLDGNIGAGKTTLLEKFRRMKDVKVIDEPVDVWSYFRNGD